MSNTTDDKEFFDLIANITKDQTFVAALTDKQEYNFKQISTLQLKELVKTVVDSPLTQSLFNTTITKTFKDNIVGDKILHDRFNVIDRLIFTLETRINSISHTIVQKVDGNQIIVNLTQVLEKLRELTEKSSFLFSDAVATEDKISITYGVPTIDADDRLNREVYKEAKSDVENTDELRKLIGEAFINEITKAVKIIQIEDREFDLSSLDFKTRVKMVESLPANLIKRVIMFVEKYKQVIESSLEVNKNFSLPIDGSLFSLK